MSLMRYLRVRFGRSTDFGPRPESRQLYRVLMGTPSSSATSVVPSSNRLGLVMESSLRGKRRQLVLVVRVLDEPSSDLAEVRDCEGNVSPPP